jgi:hypothetical protein
MSRSHGAVLGYWIAFLATGTTLYAQVLTPPALNNEPVSDTPVVEVAPTDSSPVVAEGQAVGSEVRRLHYQFRLDLRGTYDDNITLSSHDQKSDFYIRIDPVIVASFGEEDGEGANFLSLEYDPDIVFFFDHSEFNTFQNVIQIRGRSQFSRLTLDLNEQMQFLNGSDINQSTNTGTFVNAVNLDVRGQPRVNLFNTQLTATYDLSGKTSLAAGFQHSVSDYDDFISSQRVSGNLFLNYDYGPKLNVGVGVSLGREIVDEPTPDQTFEQINVRASYVLTGKLTAHGSAGVEIRQFDSDIEDHVSPVFELSLDYTPSDGTQFSLSGSRSNSSSASLAGQDFTSTQFTASIRQRILQRFFVSLTGGYQNQTYFGASPFLSSTREDNYYFIQPAIDVRITRYWYIGGYYLHRQNDSSDFFFGDTFGFNENQAGIRSTLTF